MRTKIFKNNDEYFDFINKNKDKINEFGVSITQTKIILKYEVKNKKKKIIESEEE